MFADVSDLVQCVWTFLALVYLMVAPVAVPNFHNKWSVLGVEGVTVVFW